jgi:hypothetical protein
MTWVAAAVASAGATVGAVQYFKGKADQKKNKRPTYEIPEEAKQNLTLAQQMALQGIPEAQRQNYIDNIQRTSATSLRNLGSRNAALAGVAQVQQQQNNAYQQLFGMDAQARQANQKGILDQNQNLANYRDQAFQLNSINPYYEKTAQNQAMMGAGLQNFGKSFQMGASTMGKYGSNGGGGYLAQGNPYTFNRTQYNQQSPDFYNYNPNSIQFDPNNGNYNNDNQDLYNDIG